MVSWLSEPARVHGTWSAYRQVDPSWPPLYHAAGEPSPSQESGRWHRQGEGYVQYMSLQPLAAWAEWARRESIRSSERARAQRRDLWLINVEETDIADLSSFDRYQSAGLDPRIAVADHAAAQDLADELRAAGYRGLLSPSAALPGATNLSIFGERYEKVLLTDLQAWTNPDPGTWLPCSCIAEAAPLPLTMTTATVFRRQPHAGYRSWLHE